MPEITYLKSQRKSHLKTHFELRGSLERGGGGRSWWFVYDDIDRPPELIGPESNLPAYAIAQLAKLRAEPRIGDRRCARYIDADLVFMPGKEHNGIPHEQNVEWLRQYKRSAVSRNCGQYHESKGYLVLLQSRNEDFPLQIWESRATNWQTEPDSLDSEYRLVWKYEEVPDE